jgi:hypothetical protein
VGLRGKVLSGITTLVAVVALALGVSAGTASATTESQWDRVARCEASGNWHINTGNGYSGGLQIKHSTWRGFGGRQFASIASQASKAEQIVVGERILAAQGWHAWPVCSKKAGLS